MRTSKEKRREIEKAEEKYQLLVEKRDELNRTARIFREERDSLNKKKSDFFKEIDELKKKRNELVKTMKDHKQHRDELQKEGKELIQSKKGKRGKLEKSIPLKLEELKVEIKELEYRQETVPMKTSEEEELIGKLRERIEELDGLKKEVDKQERIKIDLSNLDGSIDKIFEEADKEHELVVKCYGESQKYHKKMEKMVKEVASIVNEANKKHEEYMKVKERADRKHQKAMEMLGKIISIKKERRERWKEAKKLIEEQNIKARKRLADEKLLKEAGEEKIKKLKEKRKISLR